MEFKWQKMFHLELVPAERIPNLWTVYNGKAGTNRENNDLLVYLQLFGSISSSEDAMILNVHAPNNKVSKYIKQKLV